MKLMENHRMGPSIIVLPNWCWVESIARVSRVSSPKARPKTPALSMSRSSQRRRHVTAREVCLDSVLIDSLQLRLTSISSVNRAQLP